MAAAQWLGLVLQASIMLTVLGLGLTASFQDATFLFRRPALLLRAFRERAAGAAPHIETVGKA